MRQPRRRPCRAISTCVYRETRRTAAMNQAKRNYNVLPQQIDPKTGAAPNPLAGRRRIPIVKAEDLRYLGEVWDQTYFRVTVDSRDVEVIRTGRRCRIPSYPTRRLTWRSSRRRTECAASSRSHGKAGAYCRLARSKRSATSSRRRPATGRRSTSGTMSLSATATVANASTSDVTSRAATSAD